MLLAAPTPELRRRGESHADGARHPGRERAGGVRAGGRPSDGGRARRAGVERARGRRDRRAGRGRARAALPSRAPLRSGRALRGGAGGADAAPFGGRSARARLELRAGAAVRRGDPRGRDPVRGDARVRRRARRRGGRPIRARRGALAGGRSQRRRRRLPARDRGRRQRADRGRRRAGAGCASPRRDRRRDRRRSRTRWASWRRRAPRTRRWRRPRCARRRCCASPPGQANDADLAETSTWASAESPPRVRADMAVLKLLSAAQLGEHAAVGEALIEMASLAGQDSAASFADTDPPWKADLLARAVARARLAGMRRRRRGRRGGPGRRRTCRRWRPRFPICRWSPEGAWPRRTARHAAGAGAAQRRPVRHGARSRGRARRRTAGRPGNGAGDLRQRHRKRSGTAGSVVRDPARGARGRRHDRRSAGAGAPGRRGPRSRRGGGAAREAAAVYERAGRVDDAITALAKCVELRPNDSTAYMRAYQLLRADLEAPGRAILFDALLSHRLAAATLTPAARVALLFERGQHRLQRVDDREAAFADFKEILKIQPEHREALFQLARGASEDRDPESAAHWLVQFLAVGVGRSRARPRPAWTWRPATRRSRTGPARWRPCGAPAGLRPGDPKPLQRLSDLHLRQGEWKAAVEALRASESRLPDVAERAALHLRIGSILRDLGRDAQGAAAAFRRAAELDPLGEGTRALVALHDAAGDSRRRAGHRRSRGGGCPARARRGSARREAPGTSARAARDGARPRLDRADRRSARRRSRACSIW